jgi:hypothetical protein
LGSTSGRKTIYDKKGTKITREKITEVDHFQEMGVRVSVVGVYDIESTRVTEIGKV